MTGVIDTVCRKNNIVYWITAGTLLGSHRDGDIIRHDDDVDLAVPIEFIDKLKQEITKNGLKMNKFANGLHKIHDPEKCGFIGKILFKKKFMIFNLFSEIKNDYC